MLFLQPWEKVQQAFHRTSSLRRSRDRLKKPKFPEDGHAIFFEILPGSLLFSQKNFDRVLLFLFLSYFYLYYTNLAKLWRLWLAACRLGLTSWRLGACSFWLFIVIRGPKRSQLLAMILSSAAIVSS